MRENLPSYDVRRKILAGDALASVDGFRVMILLTFKYLFGIRCCPDCPDCNVTSSPCQDLFGNSAYAEGGAFGRASGLYISIEAQKSAGSLHAHGQLHIECLHQHRTLFEVMSEVSKRPSVL